VSGERLVGGDGDGCRFPENARGEYVAINEAPLDAIGEPVLDGCNIHLGWHQQQASPLGVFRVGSDDEGRASLIDESHAADDRTVRVLSTLGKVIVANDGNPEPGGHFAKRFEDRSHIGVLVGIDLAEIARNRINDHKANVAKHFDLLLKLFEIGLEAECSPRKVPIANRPNRVNYPQISTCGYQPGNLRVLDIILSSQD
jgi:hypothetical protein